MEHWYIWALAIYYLGAKAFGQWSRPALLVVLASISIWQCSFRELPFSLAHSNALRFAFFFAAGAWGADFWKANMSRLAAWVATFALPPFLLLHWGNAAPHVGLGLTVFLELVFGALAGSAGAVLLARNGVASALLCRLGRNTLPIYLGHVFPLAALIRTWAAFGIDQTGFHLLLTPAAVVVGVGAPLAMRFVVCKLKMAWLYSMPWADLVGAAPGDLRGQSTVPADPSRAAA